MNKVRTYIRYVAQIAVCTLLIACMCMHGMDHNDTPQQYRQNSSRNSEDTPHFDEPDSPTIHDERSFQPLFELSSDRSNDPESDDLCSFISDVGNSQHTSGPVNDSHESPIGHINFLSSHSHSHMSPLSNPLDEEISRPPIDLPPRDVIDGENYENSISNERETTDSNQQQGVETTAVETGEATLETNENHEDTPQGFTTNSAMPVSNLANDTATSQQPSSIGSQKLTTPLMGASRNDSHIEPIKQALKEENGVLNKRGEYVPYFDASRSPYCPICMISAINWQGHINSASHKSNEAHFKSDDSSICARYARCKKCKRDISNTNIHTQVNCISAFFFESQSIQNRIEWAVKHGRGYIIGDGERGHTYRPYLGKGMTRAYCPVCDTEVKSWTEHLNSNIHKNSITSNEIAPCSRKALCIECNSPIRYTFCHRCKYNRAVDTSDATSAEDSGSHSRDKGKEHINQSDNDYASGIHSNFFSQQNNDQNRADQIIPAMTGLHSNIVPAPNTSQPSRKRRRDSNNHHNKEPRREESDQTREDSADMSDTVTSDNPALEKGHGFLNGEKKYVPYFKGSQRLYCPICMISVVDWQCHLKTTSHASNEEYFTSDGSSMCARYARCTDCNKDIFNTHHHTPVNCKPNSESAIQSRIDWAVLHHRGHIVEDRDGSHMYRPYSGKDMLRAYCPACNIEVKRWGPHLSSDAHKNNIADKDITKFSEKVSCNACGNAYMGNNMRIHLTRCSKARPRNGGSDASSHK